MGRRSINVVLLACAIVGTAASTAAEPFGRYGYSPWPRIAGISLDANGFRAKANHADTFRFDLPLKAARAVATSPYGQTLGFGTNQDGPSKGRFSVTAPGFALYFPGAWKVHLTAIGSPYLSWSEGSVTAGVPTPATTWLMVSFLDSQPPWMIGFPGGPASIKLTGRPGDWSLESAADFKGWVRFGLPIGTQSIQAASASSLGELTARAIKVAPLFEQMPPELAKVSVLRDRSSVTGTWSFDRPGAIVPLPLRMASLVGNTARIQSALLGTEMVTEEGPQDILSGTDLTVRFPLVPIPRGRALTVGPAPDAAPASVAFTDTVSIADLALRIRLAGADPETLKLAEETSSAFLGQAPLTPEPNTGQPMPFDLGGADLEVVAAQGLLSQARTSNSETDQSVNSLLTSLSWRMDWFTWRIQDADPDQSRRAAALASVAGAMGTTPESQLVGAMWEAGLASERGFDRWQRRRGILKTEPARPDPFLSLRRHLYGYAAPQSEIAPFAAALASPARIFGNLAVNVVADNLRSVAQWRANDVRVSGFSTNYAATWTAKLNLPTLGVMPRDPFFDVSYAPETNGPCEAWMDFDPPKTLPATVAIPIYDPKPLSLDPG